MNQALFSAMPQISLPLPVELHSTSSFGTGLFSLFRVNAVEDASQTVTLPSGVQYYDAVGIHSSFHLTDHHSLSRDVAGSGGWRCRSRGGEDCAAQVGAASLQRLLRGLERLQYLQSQSFLKMLMCFDGSLRALLSGDEPFIYKVGNTRKVIKGLDEAIRGMK